MDLNPNAMHETRINQKSHHYYAIWKLLYRTFWADFSGPFFIFIFPLIYLFLLVVINDPNGYGGVIALPGITGMIVMAITVNSFPVRVVEFKKTGLIRRIALTPLSKTDFLIALVLWYCFLTIFSTIWTCAIDYLSHIAEFNNFPTQLYWGAFITGFIYFMIYGVTLGLFISVVAKTQSIAGLLAFVLFIIPAFFAGILIPISVIEKNQVLNIISLILPVRHIMTITSAFSLGWATISWYSWLIPPVFSAAVFGISAWAFRWDA